MAKTATRPRTSVAFCIMIADDATMRCVNPAVGSDDAVIGQVIFSQIADLLDAIDERLEALRS